MDQSRSRLELAVLTASVGAAATCAIVYQLAIGTVSTYLAGNSTFQYSLTIGLFMSAYGMGSFASTRVERRLLDWFIWTEVLLGFLGGISSLALFLLYGSTEFFGVGRVFLILGIGSLIGLEIPILIRLSESLRKNLRVTVGEMMGFDYIGALVGGLAFPFIFLPIWGLLGAPAWIGMLNIGIAGGVLAVFWPKVASRRILAAACLVGAAALGVIGLKTHDIEQMVENSLYEDPVVYMEHSPYQRLVITRHDRDTRLYLDGSLQFSSADEYRYHEMLVHPGATRLPQVKRVLVLGGGDGLALRELTHYPDIEAVVLVDLDPAMTRLGKTDKHLVALNERAFERLPIEVRNEDAYEYAEHENVEPFDLILVDLPDPHHESLAKLYSVTFYKTLRRLIRPDGLMAVQIGSPFFANRTFWTSVVTLEAAGWNVRPYSVDVPSFGIWGFALASVGQIPDAPRRKHAGKYYDSDYDAHSFRIPPDLRAKYPVETNTLVRPVIVSYFRDDWRGWN